MGMFVWSYRYTTVEKSHTWDETLLTQRDNFEVVIRTFEALIISQLFIHVPYFDPLYKKDLCA